MKKSGNGAFTDVGAAPLARGLLGLAVALGTLTGCDEPLVDPQDIEGMRVLGARLEVEGDASRATPRPGETAVLRWLVATPDVEASADGGVAAPAVAWALSACAAVPDASGVDRCTSTPFAEAVQASPIPGQPFLRFTVPLGITGGTPGLAVVGAVCDGPVDPSRPGDHSDCASGSEGTRVVFGFDVSEGADDNHNPAIAADAVSMGSAVWNAATSGVGECAGTGLREVRAGSGKVEVGLVLDAASAEPLERGSESAPSRETLLVAHFATAGKLERVFSRPRDDGASLRVTVDWKPPKAAPPGGRAARLYFVVRDDRGGADFTERTVCVVP